MEGNKEDLNPSLGSTIARHGLIVLFLSPRTTMTASRTDLLAWLNELLQISYTKIEQCGTGGAYCQVLDSIYGTNHILVSHHHEHQIIHIYLLLSLILGDLPMNRVKMTAKHEYEYLANYKVMQNVFKAKKIDKVSLKFGSECIWY